MSKSKGNVIEPWVVLDRQGADAFRWYLLTAQSPWDSFRFSLEAVDDAKRRFLLTLWNTYAFLVTYAALPDGWSPGGAAPAPGVAAAGGPLDPVAPRRHDRRGHRAPGGLRRDRRRAGRSRSSWTTSATGTCARRGAASGAAAAGPRARPTATRPSPRSTSACPRSRCWSPRSARSWPRRCTAPWSPPTTRRRPRASTSPTGRRPATGATRDSRTRWPPPARPWPWAAGRGPRPRSRCASRSPRPSSPARPTVAQEIGSLVDLVAEELNVRSVRFVTDPGELVDVSLKPNYRRLGPRFGKRHARGRRRRRRAGAGRDRACPRRRRAGGDHDRRRRRAAGLGGPAARGPPDRGLRGGPGRRPRGRPGHARSRPSCGWRRSRARSSTRSRVPAAPRGCAWRSGSACTSTARASPGRPSSDHRAEIAAETLATELTVGHGAPFGGIHHEEHVLDGEPVALRLDRA